MKYVLQRRFETAPPPQNCRIARESKGLSFSRKIKGFTLAEVLITLGIIGVVAALTLPTLIQKYQKKAFATKVKQTYSIVSNALISSIAENGAPNTWNFNGTIITPESIEKIAKTYFVPYFNIIKDGRDTAGRYYIILSNGTILQCALDGYTNSNDEYIGTVLYIVVNFNGDITRIDNTYKDFSRQNVVMLVPLTSTDTKVKFFQYIDGVISFQNAERDKIINDTQYGCSKNVEKHMRWNCGALIQHDNWEIKDDYPWR